MTKKKETAKKTEAKAATKAPAKTETKAPAKTETKKPETKAETKKPAKAPAKTTPTKAPAVEAEAAKKEEPEVPQEELKIIDVPDACDAVTDGFKTKGKVGFYEEASDDCKQCGEEFPEAMKACKQNTETEAKMAAQKKAPKKKVGGSSRGGEKTPLGGAVSSGAGRNELLLLSKEGASMEDLQKNRGAVSSHLADLKKRGHKIELKNGRYYATVAS